MFYLKTEESIHSNMSTTECELKLAHSFRDVTVPTIDVQTPSIFLFIFVPCRITKKVWERQKGC